MTDSIAFDSLSEIFALASQCVRPNGRLDTEQFIESAGLAPADAYMHTLVDNFAEAIAVLSAATQAMQGRVKAEREFAGKDAMAVRPNLDRLNETRSPK